MKKMAGKIADYMLSKIGFEKEKDDQYSVEYTRYNEKYRYTQRLSFVHKRNRSSIVQSYDEDLMDEKKIGNTCVGLDLHEMKLCALKMWSKGWK